MNTIHGNIWLRRCDDVMRRHKGNLIPCLRSRGSSQTRSGPWPSFLLAGLILHCTLLTVAVSAQAPPATGLSAWADSWNGVHAFVVWSQSAAPDHTHPYDFAWSGGADGSNPKMVIGAYSDSTQGQQSLAWYQANHPDWILYDCDQVTPSLQVGYQAPSLDFTNPAVVDYLVSSMVSVAGAPASAISWDNFSLDNDYGTPEGGYGHFCGVWANGTWVQKFAGIGSYDTVADPQYTDARLEYARQVRDRLHALPTPLLLIANSGMLPLSHDLARQAVYIQNVDGILDEAGYGDIDLTTSRGLWLAQEKFIEMAQTAGKAYYSVNELNHTQYYNGRFATDQGVLQFALATYLMSKGHSSGIFVGYNEVSQWFAEYAAPIGPPCGAMTQVGQTNAYIRQNSGGVSLINTDDSATIGVPLPGGTFMDLYGNKVASPVSMPPTSGLVLLNTSVSGCGTPPPPSSPPSPPLNLSVRPSH